VNQLAYWPQFRLLSGDVTEFGSREQFHLGKEILDGIKIPATSFP